MSIFGKTARGRLLKNAIALILVGVIMLGLAIFFIFSKSDVEYVETTGKIVNIEEMRNLTAEPDEEEWTYTVYVDYTVDGKEYKNVEYGAYDSSMEIGDEVTIEYNAEDPAQIQAPGADKVPYIVGAASILIIIFGVVALIKALSMPG